MRNLERTRKNNQEPIKGKRLETEYEEENCEMVVNDLEIIMEIKVQKEVDTPMQFMALKAARQDMEKRDKQSKEKERLEEEQIIAETGLDPWVDHEETLGEKMPEEILMDDTVPVVQERPSLKIKFKMTQENKKDKDEKHTKEQKAEKTALFYTPIHISFTWHHSKNTKSKEEEKLI